MGAIVHFGIDPCARIPIFLGAGYAVHSSSSTDELGRCLRQLQPDGVVFCDRDEKPALDALSVAQAHGSTSLILFQNPTCRYPYCESEFDLVIPALTKPDQWLRRVAETLQRNRALLIETRAVRKGSAELREAAANNRDQTALERKRSRSIAGTTKRLLDAISESRGG